MKWGDGIYIIFYLELYIIIYRYIIHIYLHFTYINTSYMYILHILKLTDTLQENGRIKLVE